MKNDNSLYVNILESFLQLSFEERLVLLKQLISSLQEPKNPPSKYSLLNLVDTGKGIYNNIDTYLENERNWE